MMAAVVVDGLNCRVTYNITAGGKLNETLVGPRSWHGTITAGPCPINSVNIISDTGKHIPMIVVWNRLFLESQALFLLSV